MFHLCLLGSICNWSSGNTFPVSEASAEGSSDQERCEMLLIVCCRSREPNSRLVQKPYEPEVTPVPQHKPRPHPHQPETTSCGQRISPDRRSSSPDSSHGVLQPDSLPAGQVPMQLGFPASAPASATYPSQVRWIQVIVSGRCCMLCAHANGFIQQQHGSCILWPPFIDCLKERPLNL